MQASNLEECLKPFINYLKTFQKNVILVAHNGKVFDARILVKSLQQAKLMDTFQEVVIGFVDTLTLFKSLLPGRKSDKQEGLVADCLHKSHNAHNGLADVQALRDLLAHMSPNNKALCSSSFSLGYITESLEQHGRMSLNYPSLLPLVHKKAISQAVAKRIAGAGLNLLHLQLIYARGGHAGL